MSVSSIDDQEFLKLYNQGLERRELAQHFGVSVDTVTRMRRKLQLPAWGKPIGFSRLQYEPAMIQKAIDESNSVEEARQKLGCCRSVVNNYMRANGIPKFKPRREKVLDYDEIARLAKDGLTVAQIANRTGYKPNAVAHIVQDLGLAGPPRNRPLPQDLLDRALALLEDGASYPETARTVGCSASALRKRLPGYQWTASESGQFAMFLRYHGGRNFDLTSVSGREDEQ